MTKNQSLRKTYAYRNRNLHSQFTADGPNGYRNIPSGVVSALVGDAVSNKIQAVYFTDGSVLYIDAARVGLDQSRRVVYDHEGTAYCELLEWNSTSKWRKRPTPTHTQGIEAEVAARTKHDGGLASVIGRLFKGSPLPHLEGSGVIKVPESEPQAFDQKEAAKTVVTLKLKNFQLQRQLKELSEKHSRQGVIIARMQEAARINNIEHEKRQNQLKAVEKVANDRGNVIQQLTAAYCHVREARMVLAGVLHNIKTDSALLPLLRRLRAPNRTDSYDDDISNVESKSVTMNKTANALFEAAVGDSKVNGCTAIQDQLNGMASPTPKRGQPTTDAPWSSDEFRSDGWSVHPSSDAHVYKGRQVLTMVDYMQRFGKPYQQ